MTRARNRFRASLQLTFRWFPGLLLEGMENVNAFGKFGHIKDSMLKSGVDADFLDAGSHSRYRSPIVRLEPLLDAPQLEARNSARIWRESLEVDARRSEPKQRLIGHGSICKY